MAVISREGQQFQAQRKLWRDMEATATTAHPATDADPKQPRRSAGRRTTDESEGQHVSGGGSGSGSSSGGSSGGGGFAEWRQNNRGWAFILGVACMLLVIIILFLINDFFTEKQVTRLERLSRIPATPAATQASPILSLKPPPEAVTSISRRDIAVHNGQERIVPTGTRLVFKGPMSATLVNSAERIKGYSGDFKLYVEDTGHRAWTPGFSSKSTPMSVEDFLTSLRQRQGETRIRIFVNSGVVELNT